MRKVILSIKPKYASLILDGKKTVEYRKNVFKDDSTHCVIIYSTSPVRKVVGEFAVSKIERCAPIEMWEKTKRKGAISERDFFEYFSGKDVAYAYVISRVKRYAVPLELSDFGIATPPQNFCYIDTCD